MDIKSYQGKIRSFIKERDWDQFHNPKNLVMALSVEAGELVEIFQWLTPEQSANILKSSKDRTSVEEEIADIFVYLLRLCDQLDIDLEKALNNKMIKNGEKYPVSTSKGIATKYNQKTYK